MYRNVLSVFMASISCVAFIVGALAAPVSDERLKDAASNTREWLTYGRTYDNQRYSPLTQITSGNVHKLVPKWIYQTGTAATFQTSPIVADGVMYISMPFSHVAAIDARTGKEIWRYNHQRRTKKLCCGPANRGVGIGYGYVFVATVDARLIALDQETGKPVWDTALTDDRSVATEDSERLEALRADGKKVQGSTGVGAAAAPLVVDGLVITGITGVGYGLHLEEETPSAPLSAVVGVSGRYGRPGFIAAFDAQTGRKVWQFDTTQEGWEGKFARKTREGIPLGRNIKREKRLARKLKDAWRYGGGSFWQTPAVDVERGVLYFGVGNPSPQAAGDSRPGDNLYTSSLVALDLKTGKRLWHFQQVPHDIWGYDVATPPVLFELKIGPMRVPALAQASKLGWVYVHDRRTGRLIFKSDSFVPHSNLFKKPTKQGVTIAPGVGGGANWSPVSFNAKSGYVFVPALHLPTTYRKAKIPSKDGKPAIPYTIMETKPDEKWGTLTALNLSAGGRKMWQVQTDEPLVGGVLATAGGLVFTGEGNGMFTAFDSRNGQQLWQFNCGAGVNAPPISFELDGRQYVAVAAGGSKIWGYPQGGAVIVFALIKGSQQKED